MKNEIIKHKLKRRLSSDQEKILFDLQREGIAEKVTIRWLDKLSDSELEITTTSENKEKILSYIESWERS